MTQSAHALLSPRKVIGMKRQTKGLIGLLVAPLAVSVLAQVLSDEDPVKLMPQYFTVRFENDQVRVLEFRMGPGEREVMHSHPPGIVYYLSDATVRVTLPNGSEYETSVKKGDVYWRDFTRHASVNTGPTDAMAIAIELKEAAVESNTN